MTVRRKVYRQLSLIEESYINKESENQLRSRYDQFISSKYVAVSRLKCKIYRQGSPCDGLAFHSGEGGWGNTYTPGCCMLQSKPDITTVLMVRLTCMRTFLGKIPHLQ